MTLDQLRLGFAEETSGIGRLTASSPPIVRTVQESAGRYEVIEEAEPADANGRNLSAAMVTLIGSITAELTFYSPHHPVRRAWAEFDRLCRRRHRGHYWRDHAGDTPLCGQMLWNVLADGASVLWCSNNYHVSYPRADRLIEAGLQFIQERLARREEERLGIAHDREHCVVCREEAG